MNEDALAVPRANRRIADQLRAELADETCEVTLGDVWVRAGLRGAAAIVHALAATDPIEYIFKPRCRLCLAEALVKADIEHKPECPWRMARLWVAANSPTSPTQEPPP